MQKPLVSILTPFKNTKAYVENCIHSIINQSYTNWELLIIDDHSTDNSYNLVEEFAKNDTRIKLYKNTGKGIIDALRLAFSKSKGQFITRMDSDDIMSKNKLEILVKNLTAYGKQHIAIGQVNYFSDTAITSGYKDYEHWLNKLTAIGANFSEIYKECVIPSPCWLAYKEDLIACGAFNHDLYPEDYDLTFRFYKQGFKCISCHDVLHQWRDHSKRTSKNHENYKVDAFTQLKIHHFLDIDYNSTKLLVVLGAGQKGKLIAKELITRSIPFKWISENPAKKEKNVYGKTLQSFMDYKNLTNTQTIITFSNAKAQNLMRSYFKDCKQEENIDFFFFC